MTLDEAFEVLAIKNRNISKEELRKVRRDLNKKFHPDNNGDSPVFEEMSKKINEAYSVISDYREKCNWSTTSNTGYSQSSSGYSQNNSGYSQGNSGQSQNRTQNEQQYNSGYSSRESQWERDRAWEEEKQRRAWEEQRARQAENERRQRAAEEAAQARAKAAEEAEKNRDHSKDKFTTKEFIQKCKETGLVPRLIAYIVFFTAVIDSLVRFASNHKLTYLNKAGRDGIYIIFIFTFGAAFYRLYQKHKDISMLTKIIGFLICFGIADTLGELMADLLSYGLVGKVMSLIVFIACEYKAILKMIHFIKDNPYPPEKLISSVTLMLYSVVNISLVIMLFV